MFLKPNRRNATSRSARKGRMIIFIRLRRFGSIWYADEQIYSGSSLPTKVPPGTYANMGWLAAFTSPRRLMI